MASFKRPFRGGQRVRVVGRRVGLGSAPRGRVHCVHNPVGPSTTPPAQKNFFFAMDAAVGLARTARAVLAPRISQLQPGAPNDAATSSLDSGAVELWPPPRRKKII